MPVQPARLQLHLGRTGLPFRLRPAEAQAVLLRPRLFLRAPLALPRLTEIDDLRQDQTSRLCSTAAAMKDLNSGCGSKGRDFSSGWNCTPMNQGWSVRSTISGNSPSGDSPENSSPL